MSSMRILVAICLFGLGALPAGAGNVSPDEQLRTFATCAGRLSALLEFQWTHDTASAEETQRRRSEMLALTAAVMPPDAGRDVLILRVNAKAAYAHLLRRAIRTSDPSDASWAARHAEQLLAQCTSMLL